MSAIGQRVQSARVAKGWSQRDLEHHAQLCVGHVSIIERGLRKRLTAETLSKLAEALGCSLSWLINGPDRVTSRKPRARGAHVQHVHSARKSEGAR